MRGASLVLFASIMVAGCLTPTEGSSAIDPAALSCDDKPLRFVVVDSGLAVSRGESLEATLLLHNPTGESHSAGVSNTLTAYRWDGSMLRAVGGSQLTEVDYVEGGPGMLAPRETTLAHGHGPQWQAPHVAGLYVLHHENALACGNHLVRVV